MISSKAGTALINPTIQNVCNKMYQPKADIHSILQLKKEELFYCCASQSHEMFHCIGW